jgi:hypothetical protein
VIPFYEVNVSAAKGQRREDIIERGTLEGEIHEPSERGFEENRQREHNEDDLCEDIESAYGFKGSAEQTTPGRNHHIAYL